MYIFLCKNRETVQGACIEIVFIHDSLLKRLSSQMFWVSKILQEHIEVLIFSLQISGCYS